MRKSTGFTLLEIAVTLAILGIVVSVVYGVFAQTLAAKEHTEQRAEEFSSARSALNRIAADLQSAHIGAAGLAGGGRARGAAPAPTPTPPGGNPRLFAADRPIFFARAHTAGGLAIDQVAFSAFLRRPTAITFSAMDLGIVHYYVAELAPDSPRFGLYREALYSLSGDSFDPEKPNLANSVVLVEDLAGFELRFFDGKDWQTEWDSTDTRNYAPAPRAVEITITVARARFPDVYQTAVDLPMVRTTERQIANDPNPPGG